MSRNRDYTMGIILIFIGAAFLLSNFSKISVKDNLLILVGLAFLIGYFYKRISGYLIAGTIITAIGLVQIIDNYDLVPGEISEFIVLGALGLAFLILYFAKNIRGFIYPACFLLATGVFTLINDGYGYDIPWAFIGFIGVAFYFIYLIETRRAGQRWPLIPGTILIVVSGLIYLTTEEVISTSIWEALTYVWPALLILVGIKIILNNIKVKK